MSDVDGAIGLLRYGVGSGLLAGCVSLLVSEGTLVSCGNCGAFLPREEHGAKPQSKCLKICAAGRPPEISSFKFRAARPRSVLSMTVPRSNVVEEGDGFRSVGKKIGSLNLGEQPAMTSKRRRLLVCGLFVLLWQVPTPSTFTVPRISESQLTTQSEYCHTEHGSKGCPCHTVLGRRHLALLQSIKMCEEAPGDACI